MATPGGTDLLQRDILGQNHTASDLGQPITQRNEIVAVGSGSSATGTRSVCLGFNANDNGQPYNTVVGPENTTDSNQGTVVGYNNQVLADFAVMVGTQSVVAATSGGPTVTLGMQLNTDGALIVNAGFNNTVLGGSSQSVVIGSDVLTAINCNVSVLIGRALHVDVAGGLAQSTLMGSNMTVNLTSKTNLVLLGQDIHTTSTYRCIAIGNDLVSDAPGRPAARVVMLGSALRSSNSIDVSLIGTDNTVSGTGVESIVAIGRLLNATSSHHLVVIGETITALGGSFQSVAVGSDIATAIDCSVSVLIGHALNVDVAGGLTGSTLIGSNITVNLATKTNLVLLGQTITTTNTHRCIAVGNDLISNAATSATRTILLGSNLTSGDGTDVTLAGYNNTVSGAGVLSVVILGRTISTTDASYMVMLGDSIAAPTCSRSVLAGSSISVTSAAPAYQIVAVGYNLTLSESNGSVVLANIATVAGSGNVVIGNSVQMQGTGGSGNVLIGQALIVTEFTSSSVAIGQNSIVASSGCVVLHGTIRDTSPTSVCVNGMIYSRAGNSVVIGGTANDDCANSTLVGVNSSAANTRIYGTALGYQTAITGDGGIAIGAFASSPAHQCTIGTPNPVAEIVRFRLVCNALGGEYFAAYSAPVATDIGLIVPHHNGVSVVAKQVKTAVAPPGGSLLLYIDP